MRTHLKTAVNASRCLAWRIAAHSGQVTVAPPVGMVIERADWAIRWYGTFIVDEANKLAPGTARVTTDPARLTRGVVQFGSQYQAVDWYRFLSPAVHVVVSFLHGKPEDGPAVARHIERFLAAAPRFARIVCSARLVLERLVSWGVPRDQLVHIPIGCETWRFVPPTEDQRAAARMRFGIETQHVCVGSFQKDGQGWGDGNEPKPIKGPDLFLDAVDSLRRDLPIFVLLTGPARGFVKTGLQAMGVPFAHIYAKDRDDLARCYHALDLYLITSREEGGPMALMESMASGVPVVSSRVGMASDLIVDGVTGGLAEVGDTETMVRRAHEILALPDAAADLRARAREAVMVTDWSVVGRRHLTEVWQPLLA